MSTDESVPVELDGQFAIDEQNEAAGYRTVLDDEEADQLPADDPNVAAEHGDYNHEDHIGEPVDDDGGVAAALLKLKAQAEATDAAGTG